MASRLPVLFEDVLKPASVPDAATSTVCLRIAATERNAGRDRRHAHPRRRRPHAHDAQPLAVAARRRRGLGGGRFDVSRTRARRARDRPGRHRGAAVASPSRRRRVAVAAPSPSRLRAVAADPRRRTRELAQVQNGHLEIIKYLVKCGADVDHPIHDGATPIFIAAYRGYVRRADNAADGSRRCRGHDVDTSVETSRGAVTAAAWKFRPAPAQVY